MLDRIDRILDSVLTQSAGDETDVTRDVARDVARPLAELIRSQIRQNRKITREQIAAKAGVSKKTVERELKKMPDVRYCGRGCRGHWEID